MQTELDLNVVLTPFSAKDSFVSDGVLAVTVRPISRFHLDDFGNIRIVGTTSMLQLPQKEWLTRSQVWLLIRALGRDALFDYGNGCAGQLKHGTVRGLTYKGREMFVHATNRQRCESVERASGVRSRLRLNHSRGR